MNDGWLGNERITLHYFDTNIPTILLPPFSERGKVPLTEKRVKADANSAPRQTPLFALWWPLLKVRVSTNRATGHVFQKFGSGFFLGFFFSFSFSFWARRKLALGFIDTQQCQA